MNVGIFSVPPPILEAALHQSVFELLEVKRVMKKTKPASKKPKADRKQPSKTSKSRSAKTLMTQAEPETPPRVRFSATIHVRDESDPDWMEKLDIDLVHDAPGVIRALVTPEDCVRLVNQGFEVRLQNVYPVEPLNPALIETDESFNRWLDAKMASITGGRELKGN